VDQLKIEKNRDKEILNEKEREAKFLMLKLKEF
jgi:hypothetical protein